MFSKYIATVKISAREKVSGGLVFLYANYFLRIVYLIPLILLWRSVFAGGVNAEMTLSQMLTYTYLSNLLDEPLNVKTPASDWLSGDFFLAACKRPTNILGDFAAQTIGGWCQMLVLFSLPMALAAPFLGIHLIPKSAWFFASLFFTVTLGFAVDFMFAYFILRLKNATWLANSIRNAAVYLFSGSFIPFSLLPSGMGSVLKYSPFGSLAGAPLSVFSGIESPQNTIPMQIFWNLILWPLTIVIFNKSRERMVSYGG